MLRKIRIWESCIHFAYSDGDGDGDGEGEEERMPDYDTPKPSN